MILVLDLFLVLGGGLPKLISLRGSTINLVGALTGFFFPADWKDWTTFSKSAWKTGKLFPVQLERDKKQTFFQARAKLRQAYF